MMMRGCSRFSLMCSRARWQDYPGGLDGTRYAPRGKHLPMPCIRSGRLCIVCIGASPWGSCGLTDCTLSCSVQFAVRLHLLCDGYDEDTGSLAGANSTVTLLIHQAEQVILDRIQGSATVDTPRARSGSSKYTPWLVG